MPLQINDFVIQARFEEEAASPQNTERVISDLEAYKDAIIRECMEQLEAYLEKREKR